MSNFMQTNLPKVSPASDVIEHENAFYIFLDMPGVAKDELNIEIEGNKLFVSATAMHAVVVFNIATPRRVAIIRKQVRMFVLNQLAHGRLVGVI